MVTLAFLLNSKIEDEAIRFINSIKPLLISAKILVTKTDKNKIETVLDRKNLFFQPSLEFKGDATIMTKVNRNEVDAVFLFVPILEIASLSEFLNACVKARRVYVALNSITGDCIMQRLAIEKKLLPVSGATTSKTLMKVINFIKKPSESSNVLEAVTVPAPFNIIHPPPMKVQQVRRQEWSEQQLSFWLSENKLDYLQCVFKDHITDDPAVKLWARHETLNNYLRVKGGTLDRLVDLLVMSVASPLASVFEHAVFIRDWFLTYQSFVKPIDFLTILKAKYKSLIEDYEDKEEEEDSLRSFINLFTIWISFDPYELLDQNLYDAVVSFMKDMVMKHQVSEATSLLVLLDKKMESLSVGHRFLTSKRQLAPPPPPILPKRRDAKLSSISDVDPIELGRQITIMESAIFQCIRPKEFHKTSWTKRNASEISPNLTKFIHQNNHISNWMITELLKQRKVEDIVDLLVKFIKLGRFLFSINNFSATMAVVTALSNSAVNKLKAAWMLLPQKYVDMFNDLSELTSPLGHYKSYREYFKSRDLIAPCLPIMVATLSNLNGYEEVFADYMGDVVNWTKMYKLAECIWEILSVYSDYNFQSIPIIQQYIAEHQVWSDNLTACAIADLRMAEISKQPEAREKERKTSKRRAIPSGGFSSDTESGPTDELSENEWNCLLNGATVSDIYSKDTVILSAGAINKHLFRIKKGAVRVSKPQYDESGEVVGEEILNRLYEGQMFGEVSMLLSQQMEGTTANIIADSDVVLWIIDLDYVYGLWEQYPVLAERLNKILAIKMARRLREVGSKRPSMVQGSGNSSLRASKQMQRQQLQQQQQQTATVDSDEQTTKSDSKAKRIQISLNKFKKRFGLKNEVPIMDFTCSLKDSITVNGTLYLTQNYLCFYGAVFGSKQTDVIPLNSIKSIRVKKKYLIMKLTPQESDESELIFTHFESIEEAFQPINSTWLHVKKEGNVQPTSLPSYSSLPPVTLDGTKSKRSNSGAGKDNRMLWEPSAEDWMLILKGARVVTYNLKDVVITEGEKINRLYQLQRGECTFEKIINGHVNVLGKLVKDTDSLFGEISYLEGGNASASVVCNMDGTEVAVIEGYWLDVLFHYHPELSGKWYHYLARVLSKRLKQRESISPSNNEPRSRRKSSHHGQERRSRVHRQSRMPSPSVSSNSPNNSSTDISLDKQ